MFRYFTSVYTQLATRIECSIELHAYHNTFSLLFLYVKEIINKVEYISGKLLSRRERELDRILFDIII